MPDFIVGSPVRGEDFWFRDDFVDQLWESIEKHNVLLIAPRRIGKTSVMYRMLDKPRNGWLPIHLNVEDIKNPVDFFITLVDAIHEYQPVFFKDAIAKGWDFLKGIVTHIEKIEAFEFKIQLRRAEKLNEHWEERATQLIERVIISGNRILIIIDELPDMINGMLDPATEKHLAFLHWFRKIRDRSLHASVRWLIGGSVNLTAVLDRMGQVKLVNDLKPEVLRPFTPDEVKQFVTTMLKKEGVEHEPGILRRINELLGSPIPYFLQMFVQEICRAWKHDQRRSVGPDLVTAVFNKTLLGEMARDKLQHYRSRIDVHYPSEERDAACYLLNAISLSAGGMSRKTLFALYRRIEGGKPDPRTGTSLNQAFQRLLMYLQSDFYIEETGEERFDFASRLIKTWWKKYYGFEYGED